MSKRPKDPLREFTPQEEHTLHKLAKASSERMDVIKRAKALLAVRAGTSYREAAKQAGYQSNDTVSRLVSRFNQRGLAALSIAVGRGRKPTYTSAEHTRMLAPCAAETRSPRGSNGRLVADDLAPSLAQNGFASHWRSPPFVKCCMNPATVISARAAGATLALLCASAKAGP
jgi:transposase